MAEVEACLVDLLRQVRAAKEGKKGLCVVGGEEADCDTPWGVAGTKRWRWRETQDANVEVETVWWQERENDEPKNDASCSRESRPRVNAAMRRRWLGLLLHANLGLSQGSVEEGSEQLWLAPNGTAAASTPQGSGWIGKDRRRGSGCAFGKRKSGYPGACVAEGSVKGGCDRYCSEQQVLPTLVKGSVALIFRLLPPSPCQIHQVTYAAHLLNFKPADSYNPALSVRSEPPHVKQGRL